MGRDTERRHVRLNVRVGAATPTMGVSAMSLARNSPNSDDDQPARTYFEWERRSINNPELKDKGGGGTIPKLPPTSPWAASIDEVVGPEPLINTEDE